MVQVNLADVPVHDPGIPAQLAAGMQTTSTIRQKLIAEKLLYQNSNLLAIGTQLLETQWTDDLEFRFTIPGEMEYQYDVPEGVGVSEIEHVEHVPIGGRIKKGFISWGQTIEAGIRGNVQAQNAITQRQAELALAKKIDNHILAQINTSAGATPVAVDADSKWNGTGIHSPNIVGNVASAFNNIFNESNVSAEEIKNLGMVIPAVLYGSVITVSEINNIVQSLEKYFKTSFGLTIYPTRDALFANDVLLMVKGSQTGFFGRLKPEAIRAAGHQSTWLEQKPVVGWQYTTVNFWGAYTIPYPNTGTTTTRICKITGVV